MGRRGAGAPGEQLGGAHHQPAGRALRAAGARHAAQVQSRRATPPGRPADGARLQPCCTDQRYDCSCPSPVRGSGDADGDRAFQLQHTVERVDGDVHLGRPTLIRARAQPVADHLLEPADGRLDPGSLRLAERFLPGRGARRHDDRRLGVALGDRGENAYWSYARLTVTKLCKQRDFPDGL